ncbi:hypothetical protein [Fredinandcohnia quinoae]|uniref:Lipoprotein n=1 Tax=Fredinandcohnia quinoae TaxID=2918902 RepID=A0AAW5E291_9BACI|nr:hypothetical protein [Fredinandcohnia sp. SECRCQ15]MCH1624007.1 hypothetical protein [Fredinandcohnia sp. SECRCQ15]
MKKYLFLIIVFIMVLSGCSDDTTKEAKVEPKKEVKVDDVEKHEDKPKGKDDKKKVDATPITIREDKGDYSVDIEGDITFKENTLYVTGTTNLLPGSKLYFYIDSMSGTIIGGTDTTLVKEDGSFQLESKLPDGYDDPIIYTKIVFNSAASNEEITQHYKEDGDPLEGPFVRLYEENDDIGKEIVVITDVEIKEGTVAKIQPPNWKKPDDYGATTVWIEAEIEEDDEFVYVTGRSNLLEGAFVSGRLQMEGYITSGFQDSKNVNPDGTFNLTITNPNKKIKNLKGYDLKLSFSPTDGNNFIYISKTYGENGEKLLGNLVNEDNGEKSVEYILNVKY